MTTLANFTDVLVDEVCNSQPLSLSSSVESRPSTVNNPCYEDARVIERPPKGTGMRGQFRCTEEIDQKYRSVFSYPYFNLVQSSVIEDALYSDKSIVVCAPTGSGKTLVFEMAIVQLLMELEDKQYTDDFKIIYMAPVKALCTERLTEWYPKFTKLGLLCIEVTGDTDVDFTQLKPYKIIITTPEKWDMLTRRWRDHRGLVEVIKLFLIDEVHILNDETRGPVLEAVVSRMKTIESSAQSVHRIEQLQKEMQGQTVSNKSAPRIRFVAVSATVSNPEDVASWLGTSDKPAVFYKFGDECRPVKLRRIVEGYPCAEGTSIFKFDIILNYKLWPIIQKYHSGKPTLIFCNTRKSVVLTAETLSKELTISFNTEQKAKLTAVASSIKNKRLQALVMSGVGVHHAGLLYEERQTIEYAFRNRDLPILITTTTLAMGVNLPAHLVIVKNTQQYVNGAYQEYSISTVLQMVGRAGRPQFDTEATAVIMTRLVDKPRYQALVGGCEPLQSYLHKRLAENLNSEAALGTVSDVAQCVQWLRSTFLYVRAARDPKKYLSLPQNSPQHLISKKIEELCVKAMNGLASSGLITMDEASCIESTEAGRLMSIFYLDLETMKQIMKINGTESLERLLVLICESHELADMHLRVDERRCLNLLNRNNAAATIRFPMKGKITTRQMKLNCVIQAVLGCLSIPDPSLNQEAMKIMRIADRICKCLVIYVTRPDLISQQPQFFSAVLNSILLAKCVAAHLWENSPFVSKQLKGIGPTFSTLLASAGKINFMLLEESHPRDLERIMNKGPPAGNVLRKQVGLLPKYQLTMIPVDEKTVTVQLVLLNKSHLAENMENLTAGDSHKSYIIVGDSNNNLLLLVAFKDRDLISVFDGIITHEVMRKHSFEHKIFAHCVSSNFVGIDVQSEYMFNDLEPFLRELEPGPPVLTNAMPTKKTAERQTCITDTFKERKRKVNPDAIEKSKEKRKRENGIMENFKYLKQSFEIASKNINNMHKQNEESFNIVAGACSSRKTMNHTNTININSKKEKVNNILDQKTCLQEMDSDEFIDNEKIDSILNEIENEMGKKKRSIDKAEPFNNNNPYTYKKYLNVPNSFSAKLTVQNTNTKLSSNKKLNVPKKSKPKTAKSNYTFIELLERNLSLSDDEEKTEAPQNHNGFSDTIKSQIQKYLTKAQTKTVIPDRNIKILLDKPEDGLGNEDEKSQEVKTIDLDSEILNSPTQSNYPRYEIKEILGGQHFSRQNIKKNSLSAANIEENLICNPGSKNCDILTNINNIKEDGTRTCNIGMEDSMAPSNMDTVIIDDEDDRKNSDNDMKEEDLNDTLILNFDETSNIFRNQENFKSEVDDCNKNELDDIICVEEYNFKQYNNDYRNNAAILDSDVIMISPCEVSVENTNKSNRNINDQRSVVNTNNFAKVSTSTERSNNNPNYVVLHNNKFQDLYTSFKTDTSEKYSCLDVALKDKYQHLKHKSPTQDTFLAIQGIRHDLDSTEMDTIAKNPCSDISLKDRRHLVQTMVKENIGPNPYKFAKAEGIEKSLRSNIVLKNIQFSENDKESHKENRAIEDNKINLYELTNLDALAIMPCPNEVLKERNQLVGKNRTLTIEDNNIGYNLYESTKVDTVLKIPSSDTKAPKNENLRVEYNRPTQDKTLPIEYAGFTPEYTCQVQCNKSICYPPVSSDLYPTYDLANNSQNKLGNPSKNVEDNKQNTEYVKRYTYSASKVDVCTKQTPDFCVQVIKKVKMDLDITAIVSRKHNSSQNYKADCEETSANNKKMKLIELPKQDNLFQNTGESANKKIATVSNAIENKSTANLPSAGLSRREFPRIKNAFRPQYKAKGEEESKYNNLQMTNTSKEYETMINENQSNQHDEIKNYEIIREELDKQENDDYEETDKKLRESKSGNNSVNGDNKIKNLLQKYSKILTKNAVKTITPSCSGINRTAVAGGPAARKSQKPFKITDIHKLHANLPETIVNNKPEIETNVSQSPKANRCFEAKNRHVNSSKYAQITENKHVEKMIEYEDFDLEPIHLHNNIDLEPSKDYNIDQSMFDPKTLLQSVADDKSDEIVPPPPEFRDDITYSSGYDNEEALMADYSVTARAPELNMFTENNMEYNESIFDDCPAKKLSSCTEIETWNLSREDSWEPCNVMNLSPTQSFTIVRRNTKNDLDFMQISDVSRQERLKKFRFNQKNKLKIRK